MRGSWRTKAVTTMLLQAGLYKTGVVEFEFVNFFPVCTLVKYLIVEVF